MIWMTKKTKPMALARFRDRLDALGPDVSVWPDNDRDRAIALLDCSAEAAAALETAQALERRLAGLGTGTAPAGLWERLAQLAAENPRPAGRAAAKAGGGFIPARSRRGSAERATARRASWRGAFDRKPDQRLTGIRPAVRAGVAAAVASVIAGVAVGLILPIEPPDAGFDMAALVYAAPLVPGGTP